MYPKAGIIYLSYHSDPYILRAVESIKQISYPKDRLELIIVDNPHPEFGSSKEFISKNILSLSGNELPCTTLLPQEKNLGFAGGNNVGIRKALELGCKYVYLHNQDGFMEKDCLEKLVEAMESDHSIGAAQSLVLLYPETDLINTAGNQLHFLGFGYSGGLRKQWKADETPSSVLPLIGGGNRTNVSVPTSPPNPARGVIPLGGGGKGGDREGGCGATEIPYASGASLMLRADLLQKHGLLDEAFFAYHEDLEYSLRLKSLGYKTIVIPEAKFFHEYSFSHNKDKYYLMERNRFATILMYYKWPTILLLLPIAIPVEIGICFIALLQGWLLEKLRAYSCWLYPAYWTLWLAKRKKIQIKRTISDRQLLAQATGVIHFDDKAIDNPVLKYIANPVLRGYWWVVRRMIFW